MCIYISRYICATSITDATIIIYRLVMDSLVLCIVMDSLRHPIVNVL